MRPAKWVPASSVTQGDVIRSDREYTVTRRIQVRKLGKVRQMIWVAGKETPLYPSGAPNSVLVVQ